jgi:HK97 gp10 family phage protein
VSDVHVKGLAELQKFLDQLPAKMEKNVVRGSLRAGMKEILPVAKQNCSKVSGLLADGLKLSTSSRGGKVTASIKAKGKHGFIAPWVEYGTKAHNIAAKKNGFLSFGGIFAKSVDHPGAKPHPFLRPALDQQAQSAVIAAAEYMKNRLATKEGLDTSDIEIGVDE